MITKSGYASSKSNGVNTSKVDRYKKLLEPTQTQTSTLTQLATETSPEKVTRRKEIEDRMAELSALKKESDANSRRIGYTQEQLAEFRNQYKTYSDEYNKLNDELKTVGIYSPEETLATLTPEEKKLFDSGQYFINPTYNPYSAGSNKLLYKNATLTSSQKFEEQRWDNANALEKAKIVAGKTANTAKNIGTSAILGAIQAAEGITDAGLTVAANVANLTGSKDTADYITNMIKVDGVGDALKDLKSSTGSGYGRYNPKLLGVDLSDISREGARMLTAGVAGMPGFITSAIGGNVQEALNEGQSLGRATIYGGITGTAEGIIEKLVDPFKLVGGGVLDKFLTKNVIARLATAPIGEYVEEWITQAINPFIKMGTYDANIENPFGSWDNFKEWFANNNEAGWQGFVMGLFLQGRADISNAEARQEYKNEVTKAVNKIKGLTKQQKQEAIDTLVNSSNTSNVQPETMDKIINNSENQQTVKYSPVNAKQVLVQPNIKVTEQGSQILPKAEKITPKATDKEILISKINNNRYLTQQEKNMLSMQVETNPYNKELEEGIQSVLNNVNEEIGLKNINNNFKQNKSTYGKYANDNSAYDTTYMDKLKELNPANKSGRRTKEQWLKIANDLGTQISNMSDSEIEKMAYRSWIDNKPNNKENLNRQGQKYVKFGLNEWVNAIYDSAKQAREITKVQGKPLALRQGTDIYVTPEGQAMTTETYSDYETGKLKLPTTKTNSIYQAAKNNKVDVKIANSLMDIAEKSNIKVVGFYDENPDVEGNYSNGVIRINVNAKKPADTIFAHEFTHHLETTNAWEEVRDSIINSNTLYNFLEERGVTLEEYKQQIKDAYANAKTEENPNGIILDDVAVEKEIVAKFVENNLLKDEKAIRRMINENPGFMQRLLDFIDDLVVRFKGTAEEKELRRIQNIYNKAFAESQKGNVTSSETEYSVGGIKGARRIQKNLNYADILSNYDKAIDMISKSKNIDNETLIKETGWYQDTEGNLKYEFTDEDMDIKDKFKFDTTKMYSLDQILKHDLIFEAYPELKDYTVISANLGNKDGAIFAPGKIILLNKNKLNTKSDVAATLMHEVQHAIQVIEGFPGARTTLFGKSSYFESLGEIEAADTKRRIQMAMEERRRILPETAKPNPIHPAIREKNQAKQQAVRQSVNEALNGTVGKDTQYSINTDNKGRKLSQEQQEFFKDSKVRDEDGNLQVVYHTTPRDTKQFTVFNPINAENYRFGNKVVNFYTNSKLMSSSYADNNYLKVNTSKEHNDNSVGKWQYEGYLNIKNPFIFDAEGQNWNKLRFGSELTERGQKLSEILNLLKENNIDYEIKRAFDKAWYDSRQAVENYMNYTKAMNRVQNDIADAYAREGNNSFLYETPLYNDSDREQFKKHENDKINGKSLKEIGIEFYNNKYDKLIENKLNTLKEKYSVLKDISLEDLDLLKDFDMDLSKIKFRYKNLKTTNDIVFSVLDEIKNGKQYDGIIIKNVIDYGGKISVNDISVNDPADVYITFNSNQFKNVDNTNPTENPDIRYSIETDKQKSTTKRYLSEHANTLLESGVTLPETRDVIAKMIEQGTLTHERITDKDAQAYAEKYIIENGFEDAVEHWNQLVKSNKEMSKEEIALGQLIYNNAEQAKDVTLVKKMIADLVNEGTIAGRNLQAMSMIRKMTPDGRLYSLERSVQKINQQLRQEIGKKFKDIEIPDDLAESLLKSQTQQETDENVEKIQQYIADQIPATWQDKLNAWRYLAMLGNPRTHIRNLAGNAVFIPTVEIKNVIATGIEKTLPTAERTKAILTKKDSSLLDFAENDFNNNQEAIRGENKYDIKSGVQEKRRIFKNEVLETLRKANFAALEAEDTIFLKYHYKRAMASAIKAKGLTLNELKSGTPEMNSKLSEIRSYAIEEAQKATYRDFNEFAKKVSNLKSELKRKAAQSKGYEKIGREALYAAAEGFVPFTKTPANIVKRIGEYSPLGIAKGISDMVVNVKEGKVTASKAIDELSAGLTGTGIVGLGILLASLGLLTGGAEDKEKEEKFEKLKGNQNYALKIGKYTYTIDWAAPSAVPLFVGVEIFDSLKNKENSDIIGSFIKIADPVFEMSMLQGINSALSAYGSDNATGKAVSNMFQSYLGQYVPSLFGAVARTVDPVRRSTYADKNKVLPTGIQTFAQKQLQKIPFVSKTLPTYKDQFGRDSVTDNLLIRIFSNFLSPGYLSEVKDKPVENELTKIYEKTGNTDVLPSYASKYVTIDGEKINFTYEQYNKFATVRGDIIYNNLEKLFKESKYKNLSDEDKVSAIKKIYDYATEVAKSKVTDYKLSKNKAKVERAGNNYYKEVLK